MPLLDLGAAVAIGLRYFTIIYLTGLGGLFSERSGIVNIGLEGMMIIGTVMGAWGTLEYGPVAGLVIGAAGGLGLGLVHALATVTFRVDHIVSGVVINVVAVGLARFLAQTFFGQATQSDPSIPHFDKFDVPLLSQLPLGLGRAFEAMSPVVPAAFLLTIPILFVLNKTRFGLRLRSAGENPGRDPSRRCACSSASLRRRHDLGSVGGAGGGLPRDRGERALPRRPDAGTGIHRAGGSDPRQLEAGVVDARCSVVRIRSGGSAEAQRRAPVISVLPEQFIRMIPYVVTMIAIAGFVGRVQPPAAAGRVRRRGGSL